MPDNGHGSHSLAELLTEIRHLKQTMGRLRHELEGVEGETATLSATLKQFNRTRTELEQAKLRYQQAGGNYVMSQAEQRVADFDSQIEDISEIQFSIGGYPGGHTDTTVNLITGKIIREQHPRSEFSEMLPLLPMLTISRSAFLQRLRQLHLGEWYRRYDSEILDGTQWTLTISYSSGDRSVKFYGSNRYPYNFEELEKLLSAFDRVNILELR